MFLFADDTNLRTSYLKDDDVTKLVEDETTKVEIWCSSNCLELDQNKTPRLNFTCLPKKGSINTVLVITVDLLTVMQYTLQKPFEQP